jgi:hypothetical protein
MVLAPASVGPDYKSIVFQTLSDEKKNVMLSGVEA